MTDSLVYIGKIIDLQPIPNADFIVSATVVCGSGGKWSGIVRKADFNFNDSCIVFLPDSQLDPVIHDYMPFMKDSNWRVKMRRFKGAPSEVVIISVDRALDEIENLNDVLYLQIGEDVTELFGVTRYCKPVPAHLQGISIGQFPSFIPKTDEPNFQRSEDLINDLIGKPYYITEKADGSSTTAFKYKGEFGLCSRNLQLAYNPNNGYWVVADKYKLQETLPEGIALQWETCGPGIQSNPMGLTEISGFAFSAYNINEHRYLEVHELFNLCQNVLKFPICYLIAMGDCFDADKIETWGEGNYINGKQREGVVVRSTVNVLGNRPISFKVINLGYDR